MLEADFGVSVSQKLGELGNEAFAKAEADATSRFLGKSSFLSHFTKFISLITIFFKFFVQDVVQPFAQILFMILFGFFFQFFFKL